MAGNDAPRRRFNSIRNELFLSTALISVVAVGLVYLYVTPQLESELLGRAEERIRERVERQLPALEEELTLGAGVNTLGATIREVADLTNTRVTLAEVRRAEGPQPGPATALVVQDSERRESLSTDSAAIAAQAVEQGQASGAGVEATGRRVEVAVALPRDSGDEAQWVAIFSEPMDEIEEAVADIRDQVLLAAGIAVLMALATAYMVSDRTGRRLRQLADAVKNAARGNFEVKVPVTNPLELAEVARAFNEMQMRLANLERARRQFVANASHELRTPIFSLGGFIELLEEEDLEPEVRAEFVRSMREQITRLTRLTEDLLDLSRLDAGAIRFRPRPIELGLLASEIALEFGPRADEHKSRLEVRTPETAALAMADPDRTRQIIRILLDNALKHTPVGTKVTITSKSDDARASLTVFDEGPGIPKHVRTHMFDRFFTADESGGSGLGLSIARSLALRMNGQLSVEARRGSTAFTLDLPRARSGPDRPDSAGLE